MNAVSRERANSCSLIIRVNKKENRASYREWRFPLITHMVNILLLIIGSRICYHFFSFRFSIFHIWKSNFQNLIHQMAFSRAWNRNLETPSSDCFLLTIVEKPESVYSNLKYHKKNLLTDRTSSMDGIWKLCDHQVELILVGDSGECWN